MAEQNNNSTGLGSSSADQDSAAQRFLEELAGGGASELSDEDVDQFLSLEDPEFAKKLGEISGDKGLSAVEPEIDAETAALHDEIEKWRKSKGIKKFLFVFFPFMPQLSLRAGKVRAWLLVRLRVFKVRLMAFGRYLVTEGKDKAIVKTKEGIHTTKESISGRISTFKKLSRKLKIAFAGLIFLFGGAAALMYLTWKGKLTPSDKVLFLTSLEQVSDQSFEVGADDSFEFFFDNTRSLPNLLLIQKMVVNIKPSEGSGSNPMAAYDIYVEGLNPDVIIEVKDREPFFRDLLQRTTEQESFETLSSVEGRVEFSKSLIREMNRHLTTGEIRNIRYRNFIVKP